MPVAPCLAYLLDTPAEPGAVVTYRCTRPAGHVTDHRDDEQGRQWTSADDGVTWAEGAVYPARPDRYPWNDDPPPATPAAPVPPMPATPAPTDDDPAADASPWARARADAIAARKTHQLRS